MNAAAAKQQRKWSTQDKLGILAEVEKRPEGTSVPQIAAKHGVTTSLIYYWLDRHKRGILDKRLPDKIRSPRKRRSNAPADVQLAAVRAALARAPGVTLAEIAAEQGTTTSNLSKWVKTHGGTLSAASPGRQLALPDHRSIGPGNAPAYVNSTGPLPEAVQIALLQRNNAALKGLVYQLLEHL